MNTDKAVLRIGNINVVDPRLPKLVTHIAAHDEKIEANREHNPDKPVQDYPILPDV